MAGMGKTWGDIDREGTAAEWRKLERHLSAIAASIRERATKCDDPDGVVAAGLWDAYADVRRLAADARRTHAALLTNSCE
jgi:hypothetical protein